MPGRLSVDLARLRESCEAVRLDVELDLMPGLDEVNKRIQHGARFGRSSPSGEAQPARQALTIALRQHEDNGRRHIATAMLLIGVIEEIVETYAGGDRLAGADIASVVKRLEAALPTAARETFSGPAEKRSLA